jgi:antitoxin component YwqK of YwqJK toxin-antitoxin module
MGECDVTFFHLFLFLSYSPLPPMVCVPTHTAYWPASRLISQVSEIDERGRRHGTLRSFHCNGGYLWRTGTYVRGLLHGELTIYWPCGSIHSRCTAVRGRLPLRQEIMYPSGRLLNIVEHDSAVYDGSDGIQVARRWIFHENGQLLQFVDVHTEEVSAWDEDGRVVPRDEVSYERLRRLGVPP